jgi:hypothetical protein
MAVVGGLSLAQMGGFYWLVNVRRRHVDWWTSRVITVIERGSSIASYAHEGGFRVKR